MSTSLIRVVARTVLPLALLLPLPSHANAGDVSVQCEHVTPAGDLDGDGHGDLLGVPRSVFDGGLSCHPSEFTLVARRGVDATALWSRSVSRQTTVHATRLGLDAKDGVLVVTPGPGPVLPWQPAGNATLNLLALDGDGTMLWTRDVAGAVPLAGTEVGHLANAPLILDAVAGPADDVVVATRTRLAGTTTLTALVIDGAVGAVQRLFTHRDSATDARVLAVPDMSSDGLDDVIVVSTGKDQQSVVARATDDGRELWRSGTLPPLADPAIRAPGDLDGDGTDELLLYDAAGRTGPEYPFTLLNGARGETYWSGAYGSVIETGDVDGDDRGDLAMSVWRKSGGSNHQLELRRADGTLLSSFPLGADLDPNANLGLVGVTVDSAGDVDGDEITDLAVEQPHGFQGGGSGRRWAVQRVTDGQVSWTRVPNRSSPYHGMVPLGATLDGSGDDAVSARALDGQTVLIEGLDGVDGDVLWTRQVPLVTVREPWIGREPKVTTNADLDGDGRTDVVVRGVPREGEKSLPLVALSGRDGSLLWSR